MMSPQYAHYPPMMMPGGQLVPMHMAMAMGPAPGMPPPQLNHMLMTQLKARGQNAFFKTRLCNK